MFSLVGQTVRAADMLLDFYMRVCLVLHALNKHALDNFQVVLLLVAEDSWEVPKAQGRASDTGTSY